MPRLLAILLLMLMAGLINTTAHAASAETPPRLFWPTPEQAPRLEFLGTFASQLDLPQKSAWKAWLRRVLGPPTDVRLQRPAGIAIDRNGRILVADSAQRFILVFDAASGKVTNLFDSLQSAFEEPRSLLYDGQGRLFVVDRGKRKVLVYGADLAPLFALASTHPEATPAFVAVDRSGERIYVSATAPSRIDVFSRTGEHLFTFADSGNEAPGSLIEPQGLAFSPSGELVVADTGRGTLEVYGADGTYRRRFGGSEAKNALQRPVDLAFDSAGNLHVIDTGRAALFTFSAEGKTLLATGSSTPSSHPLGLARPTDLCIDEHDRIVIADLFNQRFSVWQYLSPAYLAQHPVRDEDRARLQEYIVKLQERAGKQLLAGRTAAGDASAATVTTAAGRSLQSCVLAQRPGEEQPEGNRVFCPVCQECVDAATFDQHTHRPASTNLQHVASP